MLEVDGKIYGFSGCHRFEAHVRLGREQILCRVRKATPQVRGCGEKCVAALCLLATACMLAGDVHLIASSIRAFLAHRSHVCNAAL